MNPLHYPNPLVNFRADPWIYRHTDGKYYYTATVPSYDRIELVIADTISGVAEAMPQTVWRKHKTGIMSNLIWAPEIHFIQGKWYIYFAAAHTEAPHPIHNTFQHRMYVLEADSPYDKWIELGSIDTGMDSFCLDATVFIWKDRLYYLWAQKDITIWGNSNVYIAEMRNPWTLMSQPVLLTKPEYDWECSVIPVCEAPSVLIHNRKIFLTYSANATGPEYCIGLLRADGDSDLLNPESWIKSPTPVFQSCVENRKYGPGHNSFTVAEDGKTPILVYHVRDTDDITGDPLRNPGRHTCVQPFYFDEKDSPIFGKPLPVNKNDPK
ncbi:MAG: family 43 glycosylhydrolase [Clostridiales bacterium]|jgi:GH43 family beta-xylosidase|nr:family 43 glycosylhydrolase [Clostridiales bacterium]